MLHALLLVSLLQVVICRSPIRPLPQVAINFPEDSVAPTSGDKPTAESCAEVTCPRDLVYRYRECKPVFDASVSKCCPASYKCKSELDRGIPSDQCIRKGVSYKIGEHVPTDNPCQPDCRCSESHRPDATARVSCAVYDCPSFFGGPPGQDDPSCVFHYSPESCCPETVCGVAAAALRSDTTCSHNGRNYTNGQEVYFEKACKKCPCDADFTDENGLGCKPLDCGIDYSDRPSINQGCVPIFHHALCCPIEFMCPGDHNIKHKNPPPPVAAVDPTTQCQLGNHVANRNGTIELEKWRCQVLCQCLTPPDFTCVEYETCEVAEAAKLRGTSQVP